MCQSATFDFLPIHIEIKIKSIINQWMRFQNIVYADIFIRIR